MSLASITAWIGWWEPEGRGAIVYLFAPAGPLLLLWEYFTTKPRQLVFDTDGARLEPSGPGRTIDEIGRVKTMWSPYPDVVRLCVWPRTKMPTMRQKTLVSAMVRREALDKLARSH